MLTTAAMRAGFSGGLVVDFPHSTRAKKHFLVLMVGSPQAVPAPQGLDGDEGEEVAVSQRRSKQRKLHGRALPGVSLRLDLSWEVVDRHGRLGPRLVVQPAILLAALLVSPGDRACGGCRKDVGCWPCLTRLCALHLCKLKKLMRGGVAEFHTASRGQGQGVDTEEEAAVPTTRLWQHSGRHKVHWPQEEGHLLVDT